VPDDLNVSSSTIEAQVSILDESQNSINQFQNNVGSDQVKDLLELEE